MREKLIELITQIDACVCTLCGEEGALKRVSGIIADHLIAHGATVKSLDGCDYCTNGKKIIADYDGDIEIVKMVPLPAVDLETGEQEEKADPPYWAMQLMLDCGEDFAQIHFCPMCGRKLPEPPKGE